MTNTTEKKILKLKFPSKNNSKEEKKELNNTNLTEKIEENTNSTTPILTGFPKIVSNLQDNKKTFKKRTFIPQKNENKFITTTPKNNEKKPFFKDPNKKFFPRKDVKPPFKGTKPATPSSNYFFQNPFSSLPTEKKTANDNIIKKKKTKKESSKPKINTNINHFNGKTFFGKIEDQTLEYPEFIKMKKEKRSIAQKQKTFISKTIELENNISLKELANKLSLKLEDVIKQAEIIGFKGDESTIVEIDIIEMIVESFGHKVIRKDFSNKEKLSIYNINIDEKNSVTRAPIVSIVGHVDHGKTSLLDKIRKSTLAKSEVGGITQQIGAYSVVTAQGKITFIDTPGHSAFSNMRQRGININDITILIISGVEGIKDQTIEAIKHIKETKSHFIIAATKCDLPGFNIEKLQQELTKYEIITKNYGGDIDLIEISSVTGKNIDLLLQTICIYAELLELKTNNNANAVGVILDSKIDSKAGVLTSLIVQQGILKVGDLCVAETTFAKVKRIIDDQGKNVKLATAGMPVEILGFNECPIPGNKFAVTNDINLTNDLLDYQNKSKEIFTMPSNLFAPLPIPCLNLILKSDSSASLEALINIFKNLKTIHSTYKIVHSSVGKIKNSDLDLTKIGSKDTTIIVNYNLAIDKNIEFQAKNNDITIISSKIIYEIEQQVEKKLDSLIISIAKEVYSGMAIILKIFNSSKVGNIAGCNVKDGKILKGAVAKVFRKNQLVFEGNIKSLKRGKDDVKEVPKGSDCGIFLDFSGIHLDDEIKCFKIEYEKPE